PSLQRLDESARLVRGGPCLARRCDAWHVRSTLEVLRLRERGLGEGAVRVEEQSTELEGRRAPGPHTRAHGKTPRVGLGRNCGNRFFEDLPPGEVGPALA